MLSCFFCLFFQFLSFVMFSIFIMEAVAVGTIENSIGEPIDVEVQAALTGLYAMIIILILMFLVKFIFDVLYIYGVTRVSDVIS